MQTLLKNPPPKSGVKKKCWVTSSIARPTTITGLCAPNLKTGPLITYNADEWVGSKPISNDVDRHLMYFWQMYNLHILEVIRTMPTESHGKEVQILGDKALHTLEWLFDDYVVHLEHHLREMVEYE